MQILAKSLDQCEVNASFTSLKIPRPSRDGLFFCVFSFSHSIFEHFFRYLAALFWIFCEKSTKTSRKSMASISKIRVFFAKEIVPWDNLAPEKTPTFQPFRCVFFAVGSLLVPNPRALLICQRCRIRLLLTCSPLFCLFFSAPSLLGATPDPKYRGEITLSGGPLFGSRFRKIEGLKTAFFFARGQVPTRRRVAACSVFRVTTCV